MCQRPYGGTLCVKTGWLVPDHVFGQEVKEEKIERRSNESRRMAVRNRLWCIQECRQFKLKFKVGEVL